MQAPHKVVNSRFTESQQIQVKNGIIQQATSEEIQGKKVNELVHKYGRPIRLMQVALERKKKLSSAQQRVLSQRIMRFEGMLDEAFRKERDLNSNQGNLTLDQKKRLNILYDCAEGVVKLSVKLESAGLVDKGFMHKTLRKPNVVVGNQKS